MKYPFPLYCNKCECMQESNNLNKLEKEELKKEGSFICSYCINEEMNKEVLKCN